MLHAARSIWGNPNRINLDIIKTWDDMKLIWDYKIKGYFKIADRFVDDYRIDPARMNLIYAHSIGLSINALMGLEKTNEDLEKQLSVYKATPDRAKVRSIRATKKFAAKIVSAIKTIRRQVKEFYSMGIVLNARIPAKERDLLFDYLNAHNFLEIIPINVRSAFIAPRKNWNHSQTKGRN